MRLDNLTGKERFKYEAMAARNMGDILTVKYFDVAEKEDGEMELTDSERAYYIGSAKLGTLGGIVSIIAVAYARGAQFKKLLDRKDNIPIVEQLTEAGVLADFVAAIIGEDDKEWVEANINFTDAVDILSTFLKHNDFFALLQKVTDTVQNLQMPRGIKLDAETARNALLGGLAQNG